MSASPSIPTSMSLVSTGNHADASAQGNATPPMRVETQEGALLVRLAGAWRLQGLKELRAALAGIEPMIVQARSLPRIEVDGEALKSLDTAGAWILAQLVQTLRHHAPQAAIGFHRMPPHTKEMLRTVLEQTKPVHERSAKTPLPRRMIERVGRSTLESLQEGYDLFGFLGQTFVTLLHNVTRPARIRGNSIIRHIGETGIDAIPIISLIAFLISIVLAYQGIQQLAKFGAEIFTVNMVAISVLREMGVLLTAIMIAGRSGSAFTAEIGVMQVNEEVDAMRVIGLSPFELLVVPRFLALLVTLPILTFISDIMGLLGGMIVFKFTIGITLTQYLDMIQHVVKAKDFWVGIAKAPVFALIISVVGCLKGMQVKGSAESVGRLTTASVVASIFIVLLADALFAVILTKMGI